MSTLTIKLLIIYFIEYHTKISENKFIKLNNMVISSSVFNYFYLIFILDFFIQKDSFSYQMLRIKISIL